MPNRLAREDSPYLQQHKDNPVDWWPWCDEAFETAKTAHKAIFISIGYSSCHWCHVMEHEVFENEKIAAFLNEHFISIKVDREERPDVDKYYQEVHQLLNRRPGGWPTSIFCTPENKPFFAGTYIPPTSRNQILGFTELTEIIAKKIEANDEKLFQNADEIVQYLKPADRPKEATKLVAGMLGTFVKQASHNFEPTYGGFSQQPKFPHASTLGALLDLTLLRGDTEAKKMLTHTLSTMHRGGMYDLIDGGFCRYSVDEKWLVPHFEKMAYDNGLLCELYARAGRTLEDESYIRTAMEIADFMLEKMREDHLFYSASDADSEGGEGTYFIYDYAETAEAIETAGFSRSETETILKTLHITPFGNFEGKNIVWLETPDERPEWFVRVHDVLRDLRSGRTYPFIDKKIQVSWNAMMIRGLFELGKTDARYTAEAAASLDALIDFLMPDGKLYHTALIHSTPKIDAFLEDYAYLGTALVRAYDQTLEERYLVLARHIADAALANFFDKGRWYFSRGEFTTDADATDSSYPGSVGVVTDLLLSLGVLLDEKYRHFAFMTLEYHSAKLTRTPIYFPYLFNQAMRYLYEDRVVKADAIRLQQAKTVIDTLRDPYLHRKIDDTGDGYMLCGTQSCFAHAQTPESLGQQLENTRVSI